MDENHSIRERRRQIKDIERALKVDSGGRGVPLPTLRAARIMEGISQRNLAEKIGGSQRTIHELETQIRGAYPTTIRRLAEALRVTPADLIHEETTTISMKGEDDE